MEVSATFGRGPDEKFRVREDNGVIGNASEAIFPIFIRESSSELRAVGTGFFIASSGIFATAAHVLDESLDPRGNLVKDIYILQRVEDHAYWRPVLQTTTHPLADVAIGVASPMKHKTTGDLLSNKCLALSKLAPMTGETAATFAFPKTTVSDNPPLIDIHPGWYEGRVMESLPRGRDLMLPGACYRTSMVIHGGASGGPVFGRHGKVFAINSTGYVGDHLSYVSCISSILDLQVEGVLHPDTKKPAILSLHELVERKIVFFE